MFKWSQTDKIWLPCMLVAIVVIAILLHCLLKNKSDKTKKIPLQIISVFVVILEIAKQIYFLSTTYETYALPIHFCTLVFLTFPLAQFLPEKVASWLKAPAFAFSFVILILLCVHPSSMIGNATSNIFANFKNFHTFAFHFAVVAYFVFSVALDNYQPKPKHCLSICAFVLLYASYAVPLAFHLNSNYVNILYSNFEFLENFRLSAGQLAYDLILFAAGVGAGCLITILYWLLKKKKRRKANES